MTQLELRPSHARELGGLLRLEADADTARFILPSTRERHAADFAREDIVYLTLLDAAQTAGFIILALDSDGVSVEFRRIVVADKGAGIGQRAIALMEDFCRRQLGRKRIWLDVFDFNQRGRHIYEKLCYTRFDCRSRDGKTLLFYQKTLE